MPGTGPPCPVLSCPVGAQLLDQVKGLETAGARKLAEAIIDAGGAPPLRLAELWNNVTPAQVLELAKDDAELSIMDRIDVLKTVVYHVHADTPNSLQAAVDRFAAMGLSKEVADFVAVIIDGKEAQANMSEYFHMLEVAKLMFGVDDDSYYTVSTAVASK